MVCSVQENAMNNVPHYEFEVQVPSNLADVDSWDHKNRKSLSKDSLEVEMAQLHNYKNFKDLERGTRLSIDIKQANKWVYNLKHDLCHAAWLVARGHMTEVPNNSKYSSVASVACKL